MRIFIVYALMLGTTLFVAGCAQTSLDGLPVVDDTTNEQATDSSDDQAINDTDENKTDADSEDEDTDNQAVDTSDETVATTLHVQTEASRLGRRARKVGGQHRGTVDFATGHVDLDQDGNLVGGEFIADMTTITLEDGDNKRLLNHLKSDDFFNVTNHPTSSLTITNVTAAEAPNEYTVTADLTIKEITNQITFPATVEQTEEGVVATANFQVDRTRWDIIYRSLKYFSDIADNAIDDMYDYDIRLVAK